MRPFPLLAALLALAGCGGADPAPSAAPTATVRLNPVPSRPAAGYFEVRADGDRGALLSVTSPQAARVEMHETTASGAMSGMRRLERIPVRDGETLTFAPGGRHLMVFDIDRRVAAGGRIDLVLHFERGAALTVPAVLVPTGGDVGR
ncbi:MAG TPA: copper chaperone PCu(A)C [Allosphingosinicella sp.]|nr:copper chaperone PCu(A)C [Allosphingosinicella sp.]